jgi:hypothetical protein
MGSETSAENAMLGFLTFLQTATRDGYLGAVLVTNIQGVPQEFRCTQPVKPTAIQKPLYGEALEPYIAVELCGAPLIKSLQCRPSVVLVIKESLLGVRSKCGCPAVLVRRAGETIDVTSSEVAEPSKKKEKIESPTGRFQPVVLSADLQFEEDLPIARAVLERASHLDPLEPFDRIARAVEVLAKQDKRFQ